MSRTSKVNGKGERFDYTPKCYVAFSFQEEVVAIDQPGGVDRSRALPSPVARQL
jgi:hypothetical protein